MFEKKPDPKDELITILKEDKARLQLQVLELTKQVIALSDNRAYNRLYPREPLKTDEKNLNPLVDPRKLLYRPKVGFKDIEEAVLRREFLGEQES